MADEQPTIIMLVSPDGYDVGAVQSPTNDIYETEIERIDKLWNDWHRENPHPDCDSDFVLWLVEKHGYKSYPNVGSHTLEGW